LLLHLDVVRLDDLSDRNMTWLDFILHRHLLHTSSMPLLISCTRLNDSLLLATILHLPFRLILTPQLEGWSWPLLAELALTWT
jgi:hypothetical protein